MSLCTAVISLAAGWALAHPLVEAKARSLWAKAQPPAPPPPSELTKAILTLLEKPEDWTRGHHVLCYKHSKLELWDQNDARFFRVWAMPNGKSGPQEDDFSLSDRKIIVARMQEVKEVIGLSEAKAIRASLLEQLQKKEAAGA